MGSVKYEVLHNCPGFQGNVQNPPSTNTIQQYKTHAIHYAQWCIELITESQFPNSVLGTGKGRIKLTDLFRLFLVSQLSRLRGPRIKETLYHTVKVIVIAFHRVQRKLTIQSLHKTPQRQRML